MFVKNLHIYRFTRPFDLTTEQLETMDLAEYVISKAFIDEMSPDPEGGTSIKISGVACQLMAASFAGQFVANGGTNFVELGFNHDQTGPMLITMQRRLGKTPATLKAEADKQRDELLAALKKIHSELSEVVNSGDVGSWLDGALDTAESALSKIKEAQ